MVVVGDGGTARRGFVDVRGAGRQQNPRSGRLRVQGAIGVLAFTGCSQHMLAYACISPLVAHDVWPRGDVEGHAH